MKINSNSPSSRATNLELCDESRRHLQQHTDFGVNSEALEQLIDHEDNPFRVGRKRVAGGKELSEQNAEHLQRAAPPHPAQKAILHKIREQKRKFQS